MRFQKDMKWGYEHGQWVIGCKTPLEFIKFWDSFTLDGLQDKIECPIVSILGVDEIEQTSQKVIDLVKGILRDMNVQYHLFDKESGGAARAGVSKVSLYRRWGSKQAVMSEVFRFLSDEAPDVDHGSFEADIRALIGESFGSSEATASGQLILRTMGEISGDAELLALYRENLLEPRFHQLRAMALRARDRGELRADLPIDIACAVIAGPLFLYFLTLIAGTKVELSDDPTGALTRAVLDGVAGARPSAPRTAAGKGALPH